MLKLVVVKLSSVVWLVFWSFYLSQDDVQFISPSIIQSDKWGLPVLSSVSFFKVNMDPNLVVLLLYWIRIAYGLILFVMSEVILMLCNTALDLPGTSGIFLKQICLLKVCIVWRMTIVFDDVITWNYKNVHSMYLWSSEFVI